MTVPAAADCSFDAMIVLDASASMSGPGHGPAPRPRIAEARTALAQVMPLVEDARRIGLVTYGPGGRSGCDGIKVHFTPQPRAGFFVVGTVESLLPGGMTPLTEAVDIAATTLSAQTAPGTIVVITDGHESCGGSPCALADRLAATSVDLTIHVIGFGPAGAQQDSETSATCLAERTGGSYTSVQSVDDLIEALWETMGCLVVGQLAPLPGRGPASRQAPSRA